MSQLGSLVKVKSSGSLGTTSLTHKTSHPSSVRLYLLFFRVKKSVLTGNSERCFTGVGEQGQKRRGGVLGAVVGMYSRGKV